MKLHSHLARAQALLAILLLLAAFAGILANRLASEPQCSTDTECMEMHGGDGGPEPQGERQ
jgi:hypothetical protein